ncbi:hypothetical protein [Streptomyces sp. NBC_00140]|uniref:hypothetical protein n=1 Tax=Streptomyces sp. NBC_00140 TaxID=2975664 RepID=UPI0022503CB1|nr:hypothetical protein [Streptomyces sp. NBC_00140]MCX5328524.1 hypothetical protein [Streptomyces sp. NBC_00140]
MTEAQWDITEADLDDLVAQVREAGQDTQEAEEIKAALSGGEATPAEAAGVKRRLIVLALRYGGKALAWLLKHFSQEAAQYVIRHSQRLADFLDRAENWAVDKITRFLEGCGVPVQQAQAIARTIMAIVG